MGEGNTFKRNAVIRESKKGRKGPIQRQRRRGIRASNRT